MNFLTKPVSIAALLVIFAVAAMVGGPLDGSERAVMQAMARFRAGHPGLTQIFAGASDLGGAYATLGLSAVASLWLLHKRRSAKAYLLIATVLVERSLSDALKIWIGRPRPDFGVEWLPHSLAFPSGHSANSLTAFFLATALILTSAHHRRLWATGALVLAILVGLSRICLGVHWPTDVLGGWALGLLAVSAALLVGRRTGILEPKHEIVGRHRPALGKDEAA